MSFRLAIGLLVLAGISWLGESLCSPNLPKGCDLPSAKPAIIPDLLGGWSAPVADMLWLKVAQLAEDRDLPATETTLRLVVVIEPQSLYFWVNAARMIAYDMAVWRIDAAGRAGRTPVALQERVIREQATEAVRWLDEAREFHPASAAVWIERANLQLNRLGDVSGAAESYRRATLQPDAPFFAARLHAELLRRAGRKAEALAWLRELHPKLPAGEEAAQASLVLARIRELERELAVLPGETYREPRR